VACNPGATPASTAAHLAVDPGDRLEAFGVCRLAFTVPIVSIFERWLSERRVSSAENPSFPVLRAKLPPSSFCSEIFGPLGRALALVRHRCQT
jgi:hypothetical protein